MGWLEWTLLGVGLYVLCGLGFLIFAFVDVGFREICSNGPALVCGLVALWPPAVALVFYIRVIEERRLARERVVETLWERR